MRRYGVYMWNKSENRYTPFRWLDPFSGAKCSLSSMSLEEAKQYQLDILTILAVYMPIVVPV